MGMKTSKKQVAINPLKVSQALGGVLAFQGFFRSMPIIHGSQGCAAFIKALMTRHFREPIALQTSALQEMNVIFGSEQCMSEALDNVIARHDPAIIGVFSTALTETAGEDLKRNTAAYLQSRSSSKFIIPVSLPDFTGSLESGYRITVEAIVHEAVGRMAGKLPARKVKHRVNLLAGSHLTPSDVMELKQILQAFDLEVVTVPDISTSLVAPRVKGFSSLTRGGVSLAELCTMMLTAEITIAVGASMEGAAKILHEYRGIPYCLFKSVTGLEASDELFSFLQNYTGEQVPMKFRWERDNLLDCMLDAHFYFSGRKVAVASEPDHLHAIIQLIKELGGGFSGLVTSISTPLVTETAEKIVAGDLDDLENMAAGADLWLSNSHGRQGASRLRVPFLPIGFPVFDQLGSLLTTSIGYRGTTELLIKIANALIDGAHARNKHFVESLRITGL
ncbi:nitrogenase molybdenum-iron protein NifN [Evansella caseinilytica]|uniref:Nitrogenase iron-molybdenum cofactor biosynthesis protein NifN n=1 Tax=Evansella caseinilytica TaxID=1503961 RepID=A0A1H3I9C3_9BACI|nr:nitrogenase iron-molybdenum cofactor biosynthesis protein NifN [Evansella caseinilytica]SDY24280.1 nitrogenase molybdenum-iron protein NifN [Evansella caseinilytica]